MKPKGATNGKMNDGWKCIYSSNSCVYENSISGNCSTCRYCIPDEGGDTMNQRRERYERFTIKFGTEEIRQALVMFLKERHVEFRDGKTPEVIIENSPEATVHFDVPMP